MKVTGRNALVYIGGVEGPNKNKVTLAFNREMQEARIFQNVIPGGPWVDNIPGFRSWTCEIGGYYDDVDQVQFSPVNAQAAQQVVIYESRTNLGRYWYGNCWFTVSEEIDVNNIVTFSMKGTGDGILTRIPLV
jgi:hypothetical protein